MNENELALQKELNNILEEQINLKKQVAENLQMINTLFIALSQNRKAQQADDLRIETLHDAVIVMTDQINLLTTMIKEK